MAGDRWTHSLRHADPRRSDCRLQNAIGSRFAVLLFCYFAILLVTSLDNATFRICLIVKSGAGKALSPLTWRLKRNDLPCAYCFTAKPRKVALMSLKEIASLGKMLGQFLALFADCFHSVKGRNLLLAYVRGLLSDIGRKNVEAIALKQNVAPRTLQRFLESVKWDHDQVLRRCRQLIAAEHADSKAIGKEKGSDPFCL